MKNFKTFLCRTCFCQLWKQSDKFKEFHDFTEKEINEGVNEAEKVFVLLRKLQTDGHLKTHKKTYTGELMKNIIVHLFYSQLCRIVLYLDQTMIMAVYLS